MVGQRDGGTAESFSVGRNNRFSLRQPARQFGEACGVWLPWFWTTITVGDTEENGV
jgi:hypothetical protein